MRARTTLLALVVTISLLCFACSESTQAPELELDVAENRISGTFTSQYGSVVFSGAQIGEELFEFRYELNGMVLTEVADRAGGVLLVDGYATATGESTLVSENRAT